MNMNYLTLPLLTFNIILTCTVAQKVFYPQSAHVALNEDITLSGSVLAKQTLDCYPQINEATLGKSGHPSKGTEFTCGEAKFLMTSFSEEYSTRALGGEFPVTKTLSQIGCKLEGELLLCREEGPFKAKGFELKAYREIVAQVISTPAN